MRTTRLSAVCLCALLVVTVPGAVTATEASEEWGGDRGDEGDEHPTGNVTSSNETVRVGPPAELTVAPGTSVMFEVDAVESDAHPITDLYVDGEWVGDTMWAWPTAYYDRRNAQFVRHTFETDGSYEVTAEVDPVDGNRTHETSWTVHVDADGNEPPSIDAADPTFAQSVGERTSELRLDVSDPEGDLDRVIWWLGGADTVLAVSEVNGSEDTATLALDDRSLCAGCPVVPWVVDGNGSVAPLPADERAWLVDGQCVDPVPVEADQPT